MEMERSTKVMIGCQNIGFFSLLGLTFIVLKLCGVISWSWWWVTAPFWGPIALVLAVVILVAVVIGAIFGCYALVAR
jgi:phosphoglycerol transferase MdoB-like AlkP superfamily enzyme